jgi:hypothetical protein
VVVPGAPPPAEVEAKAPIPAPSGLAVAILLSPSWPVPEGRYRTWWRFLLVLRIWTLVFNVSTRCSEMLLKILHVMLPLTFTEPLSNHTMDKVLGTSRTKDPFESYVCCPRCHKVYKNEENKAWVLAKEDGRPVSLRCNGFLVRNHTQRQHRICGEVLMRTIDPPNGDERYLVPYLTYVYRSLKQRLSELLAGPEFEKMCELWRKRDIPKDHLGDVMDGSVWREFGSVPKLDRDLVPVLHEGKPVRVPFLDEVGGHNYPLAIFVDWFQPWRRVQYSVGLILGSVLSLPRDKRNKKENVILIGIIPGGSEKHLSLNPFLEPLVRELLELHPAGPGVMMQTHDHPKGVRVTACIICGVCDLPASKKVAGFVGHNGDKGCSRCDKSWACVWLESGDQKRNGDKHSGDKIGVGDNDEGDVEVLPEEEPAGEGKAGGDDHGGEGKEEQKDTEPPPMLMAAPSAEAGADDAEEDDEDDEKKGDSKQRRNWRRVYANPGELGTPRDLVSHRRLARAWLHAPTKTRQDELAKAHGVKYSELLRLDYWDPIRFMVIDSLHAFWLGVCRSLMVMWRETKWKKGSGPKALSIMQARLDAMRVPADVCRLLNKWSSNMSGLTGHQVKAFVGCFSVAVFAGFITDDNEIALWNLLVVASRLLSLHLISSAEIGLVLSPSVTRPPLFFVPCSVKVP